MVIQIPYSLTLQGALNFAAQLRQIEDCERLIFDGTGHGHIEPFSMAIAAREIRNLQIKFAHVPRFQRNLENRYARFMGFYSVASLDHHGHTGDYDLGNRRYRQLKRIQCDEVRARADQEGRHPNDIIEEEAHDLARVLAQADNTGVYEAIGYAATEMMRNVLEHSESHEILCCAQLWPTKDLAEIAILDSGIGLANSLRQNPNLRVPDDMTALNLAMTPGITRVQQGRRTHEPWQNAGFGLYMTSRICQEGGSFTLFSGSLGIVKHRAGTKLYESDFLGTGVRLIIQPSKLQHIERSLEQYRNEAREMTNAGVQVELGLSPSLILRRLRARQTF